MTNNIAIVCPGPSLVKWQPSDFVDYRLIFAINRAALRFEGDIRLRWCLLDTPLYRDMTAAHGWLINTTIVTLPDRVQQWQHPGSVLVNNDRQILALDGAGLFTFSHALSVAHQLRQPTQQIHIYGADFAIDMPDFDGVTLDTNNRTSSRFAREKQQIQPFVTDAVRFHK